MKVSDYIVEFLIEKGITDVFGYPGGMVTHLMDSFHKYEGSIHSHVNYHEQASAFCACSYAQVSGKAGFAYATSGPGATNLITGICQAYYDSIPVIFVTGQVNTFEMKGDSQIRQNGFQETDIVSMVKGITKYAKTIIKPEDIKKSLENAYYIANLGRKGPVLLDIPMNIFTSEIDNKNQNSDKIIEENLEEEKSLLSFLSDNLSKYDRPCILIGNGFAGYENNEDFIKKINESEIPIVSSMLGKGLLSSDVYKHYYGFIGAYGERTSNFIVAKCDLLICLGTRLDIRQVGKLRDNFAPNAQIIRIDIDPYELANKVHDNDIPYMLSMKQAVSVLSQVNLINYHIWNKVCKCIKEKLIKIDYNLHNEYVKRISTHIVDDCIITTDVGQNQIWVAQSFLLNKGQKVIFSGGHGAMGYSLPAAIGAYYASKKRVICFCGDGGLQMNIQELQFITRESLPIIIIILNNSSLGMIRHFQEMYFNKVYTQTNKDGGYSVPDFERIGNAYGIKSLTITKIEEIDNLDFSTLNPLLININMDEVSYVVPKLEYGKPNQDQEPLIDRELYKEIMEL